jgi:hypothetical protein
MRVLEKCGFTCCEIREKDFHSPYFGLRDSVVFRLARSGKTLEELGLGPVKSGDDRGNEDKPPTPPLQ